MMMMMMMAEVLETVHFQLIGLGQTGLSEPLANVFTLIALQLQHFAVFGMLDYSAIAGKLFLAGTHDFLQIIVGGEPLHSG